uniref:COX assembly mitochondrial protein n=1 Tax=Neovison vison TaxID=452646 RepID=A0A8C7BRC0_NEOVI
IHSDLSPHSPAEECNVFINLLKECHKNLKSLKLKLFCIRAIVFAIIQI